MRCKFVIVSVMLLMLFNGSAQKKEKKMIYRNEEIEISFPGSYQEVENGRFWSATNKTYERGYFYELEMEISFHEDDQQKYYETENGELIETQHIVSGNGYLSTLFIYPPLEKRLLFTEIEMAYSPDNSRVQYRKVKQLKFGTLNVLNWRTQISKNRFEYYLVIGKKHNYLFISTAYGEKEYIENILQNVKFLK